MKKVTIITGPQASGKTTLAKQMTEGRKAVFITPDKGGNHFLFHEVKEDTEVIVMEEAYSASQVRAISGSNKIMIDRQCRNPIEIDTPDLIFTSNILTKKDFEPIPAFDITIIELTPRETSLQTALQSGIIRTLTGKKFNLFEPTPDMIDIRDIATGLANKGHFSGFSPKYFSIAEHCIMVCDEFAFWNNEKSDSMKLLALLHDASEAYIGDMVKPLKIHMPDFVAVENRIMEVIAERFDLYLPDMPKIKPTDLLVQEWEYNAFFRGGAGLGVLETQISYLVPEFAKAVFLDRFSEYYHGQ